jgi:imidazolonepropionase
MRSCDLVIDDLAQVVTPIGPAPRRRDDLASLSVLEDGAVAIEGGLIAAIGRRAEINAEFAPRARLAGGGGTLLPGFVDAHTHPVFAATREREFEMRLRGSTYQEITAAGGGIFSSVRSLRAATDDSLVAATRRHFDRFLRTGTTTLEAKSGYGLSFRDELRSLEVLALAGRDHPLEVAPTFLGAHQIPEESKHDRAGYIDRLIGEMMPEVKRRGLARACDVFCDDGAYTVPEARRVLEAAKAQGFALRVHADELARLGATELAVELGAESADHLCRVDEGAIAALGDSATAAVLLPGTVLSLGLKAIPPARKLIAAGAAIVVATDFNPGTSYLSSMPLCIALACDILRLNVAEAITAATLNAAWSLGRADRIGSIEVGKQADLVVIDRPSPLFLGYELGENLVAAVVKRGVVVDDRALRLRSIEVET